MNQHLQAQWDNVIPRKIVESENGPKGGAVLLVPRFRKGPLAKWLQPRLKRPFIKVNLDDMGSFVWTHIDGEKNYACILSEMRSKFGEEFAEPDIRLQKFLTVLSHNKFADLVVPVEHEPEKTA
jgi:hypothetical protein